MAATEKVPLGQIVIDPRIQPREQGLDTPTVEEYQSGYKRGDKFPPGTLVETSNGYRLLAIGFHRTAAAKLAGIDELEYFVVKGTHSDAKLLAAGSNLGHGLKRSVADKRRDVRFVLEARTEWTNAEIAKHCGVGDELVADMRVALSADVDDDDEQTEPAAAEPTDDGKPAAEKPAAAPKKGRPNREKQGKKIAKLLKKNAERTDSDVATEVGCKPDLVATVRRELAERGKIKKKLKGTKKGDPLSDELGVPVPDGLRDLFGDPFIVKVGEEIGAMRKRILALKQTIVDKGHAHKFMPVGDIMTAMGAAESNLEEAVAKLVAAKPYAVCPICNGKGLSPKDGDTACMRSGYLTKWKLDDLVANGTIEKK